MSKKKLSRDFFYMGETENWIVYVNTKTNKVFRAPIKFKGTMEAPGKSSLYAAIGILLMNIFGVSFTSFLSTQELNFAHKNVIWFVGYYIFLLLNTVLFWKADQFKKYNNVTRISKAEKRDFIWAVQKNQFVIFNFNDPYVKALIYVLIEDFLIILVIVFFSIYFPAKIWLGLKVLSIKEIVTSFAFTIGFAALVIFIFKVNVLKILKYVKYFNERKLHFIDD